MNNMCIYKFKNNISSLGVAVLLFDFCVLCKFCYFYVLDFNQVLQTSNFHVQQLQRREMYKSSSMINGIHVVFTKDDPERSRLILTLPHS